jgi:acyl-[acyl carrier protein]--UDP-N-acetylglucosamine O-acyltransferase
MSADLKTKLISRKHVKDFALAMAANRFHQFTRVGAEFFIKVEANAKEFIRSYVRSLPSKGKTIT